MRTIQLTLMCVAVLVVGMGPVHAGLVTMDFESLKHEDPFITSHGNTYSEDGFTLVDSLSGFVSHGTFSAIFLGSTALIASGTVTLTKDGGGAFALISIELARLTGTDANVPFTGILSAGGTTSQSITTSGFGLNSYSFNSTFSSVTSVSWLQGDPSHSFDNIVLNDSVSPTVVPEPTSLTLLGIGVAGLCGYGLRRKRSA